MCKDGDDSVAQAAGTLRTVESLPKVRLGI